MHLAGYDPRSRRPAMRGVPAVPRGAGVTLPRYRYYVAIARPSDRPLTTGLAPLKRERTLTPAAYSGI
jgi:hypothetical protein